MTPNEMYKYFNLCYNNVSSHQAPGMTAAEVSVYLTRGQRAVFYELYQEYEKNEEVRKKLAGMVRTASITDEVTDLASSIGITSYSHFFELPDDFLLTVFEELVLAPKGNGCYNGATVAVTPIPHDEVANMYKNPFRCNERRALRLDVTRNSESKPFIHEIIYKPKYKIAKYVLRYLGRPEDIVIADDGTEVACKMDEELHGTICEVAAKMAYSEYKQ